MFNGINCSIQTLVLTIKVPFDIKDDLTRVFLAEENSQEDQELCTVFFRGAEHVCTAAPRNHGLEPPTGCHVPEFPEGLWLLIS